VIAGGCNLDIQNPHAAPDLEHLPAADLVQAIIAKEQAILRLMSEVNDLLRVEGQA
jgi:hypothetical protein